MNLKLMLLPLLFPLSYFAMQPVDGDFYGQLCSAIKRDDQAAVESFFNQQHGVLMISHLLLSKKLDPNMQSEKSLTSKGHALIHWAARANNADVLGILLDDQRTQIDIKNANGCTALGFAVALGKVQATSLLLQKGANPNEIADEKNQLVQNDQHTILHSAIMYYGLSSQKQNDYYKVIGLLLLDSATDPNKADVTGKTPLHYAVLLSDLKVVDLLLKNTKTKSGIKDKSDKTPLDYARECNKKQTEQLLLNHQKK